MEGLLAGWRLSRLNRLRRLRLLRRLRPLRRLSRLHHLSLRRLCRLRHLRRMSRPRHRFVCVVRVLPVAGGCLSVSFESSASFASSESVCVFWGRRLPGVPGLHKVSDVET